MSPAPTDLIGTNIGTFKVAERACITGRGVCWWLVCQICQHRCWRRASSIHKLRHNGGALACRGCEG